MSKKGREANWEKGTKEAEHMRKKTKWQQSLRHGDRGENTTKDNSAKGTQGGQEGGRIGKGKREGCPTGQGHRTEFLGEINKEKRYLGLPSLPRPFGTRPDPII